jgi:oxygen-independent coproporphyrinogen-3 oxidase
MTIEELTNSQYLFIGMDHFAKANDELAIAQRNRTLQRNFQGYTTHAGTELLGFGATSISMLHDTYVQNHKQLKEYYQAIASNTLPISKGIKLTSDDILRRDVIMCIMSNFYLHKPEIEEKYHINFDEYFAQELDALKPLEADGLVNLANKHIQVTEIGRLLVRNVAVVFDTYHHVQDNQFSRTI